MFISDFSYKINKIMLPPYSKGNYIALIMFALCVFVHRLNGRQFLFKLNTCHAIYLFKIVN